MTKIGQSVFVFGTVSAAALLWFLRPNPTPQVVDSARLLARANLIRTVAYLTGTNAPTWPSNTVSVVPSWDLLYRKILCSARDTMVTNAGALPCVLWLDPTLTTPADGDVVATQPIQWVKSGDITNEYSNPSFGPLIESEYSLSTTTNSMDCFPVTSTRHPQAGVTNMPFLPDGTHYSMAEYSSARSPIRPNYPLGFLFYGHASTNLNFAWSGSIWPRIGLGTNSYKLACEFLAPERLTLRKLGGDGFSSLTNVFEFPYLHPSNSFSLSITNTFNRADPSKVYAASAWEISSDDPDHRPGYFITSAQSAADPQIWQCTLGGSASSAYGSGTSIPKGGTGTCSFSLLSTGYTQYIFSVSAFGEIVPSLSAITVICASNSNPTASFSFLASATGQDGAGGFTVAWAAQTNCTLSQAFYISPTGTLGNAVSVSPRYNSPPILFGASQSYSSGVPAQTNVILHTNRQFKTNDLSNAAAILTNLTRSIYICPPSSISCACTNFSAWGYQTNYLRSVMMTNPLYDSPSFPTLRSLAFDGLNPTNSASSIFDGTLTEMTVDILRECQIAQVSGADPKYRVDESASSFSTSDQYRLYGCSLPYPSQYACASGYVSKATVFAVCKGFAHSSSTGFEIANGPPSGITELTVDGYVGSPSDWTNLTFGVVSRVCDWPSSPLFGGEWSEDSGCRFDPVDFRNPASMRIAKIAKFDNPTSQPTFDLSTPSIWPSESMLPYSHAYWSAVGDWDWTGAGDNSYATWQAKLEVLFFVVVVDWNWGEL